MNGRWVPVGYLPVGTAITVKRKYVAVLAGAKRDTINTNVIERDNEDPQNHVERFTSAAALFSVIRDDNPRGSDWLIELHRRMG